MLLLYIHGLKQQTMKRTFSLPTDQEFYQRYAGLVATLKKLGTSSQIISGLTEVGAIYALIYTTLVVLIPTAAPWVAVAGALLGTAVIELGLRRFVPYSVRAILYKRYKGLDGVMTGFLFGATVLLIAASGYLSFTNSKNIVDALTPEAQQQTTTAAEDERNAARLEALATYHRDSSQNATSYAAQVEATRTRYASKIDVQKRKISNLYNRQRRTEIRYPTQIGQHRENIEQLEAERDEALAALATQNAQASQQISTARAGQLAAIGGTFKNARQEVKQSNQEAQDGRTKKVNGYGLGLGWFTLFALAIFLLSVVLDEVYKKGAGIVEQFTPTQYDFSDSIAADWWGAITTKQEQRLRARISKIEKATEAPPLPTLPAPLYDITDIVTDSVEIKREEAEGDETKIVYLHDDFRQKHGGTNENRKDENRQGQRLRECEHCGDEYTYKHHKQKYCKDACRQDAWELRNGKKLKHGRV